MIYKKIVHVHVQNGGSVEPTCFLVDRLLPLTAAVHVWLWQ